MHTRDRTARAFGADRARDRQTRERSFMPQLNVGESLPADFLIGPEGVVRAAKYGEYVDDHLSVDDLLALGRMQHPRAEVQGA